MLRSVKLYNFVTFLGHQEINVNDGINVFVGENSSGKTCMLEAVRRTLPLHKNLTFSKIPDRGRPSYVVCKYDVAKVPELAERNQNILYSSFIYTPNGPNFYKAVALGRITKSKDGQIIVDKVESSISKVEMRGEKPHYTEEFVLTVENKQCIFDHLAKNSDDDDEFVIKLCDLLLPLKCVTCEGDKNDCEDVLKHLDKVVAIELPLRGLSPAEWSQSKMLGKNVPPENIARNEKDEIIKYFIQTGNYNKEKETKIFKMLTNNCNIEFSIDSNDHLCAHEVASGHRHKINIFKVPEGVAMAKEISLLLTSNFLTVGLEEPVRGMHTQMVLALRDVALLKFTKEMETKEAAELGYQKVVLMTSHNPAMLSAWTIPRCFVFQKKHFQGKTSSVVRSGKELLEGENVKSIRILSMSFPTLFFSKHALFLEGDTDLLFIDALKAKILEEHEMIRRIVTTILEPRHNTSFEDQLSDLVRYMAQLNILKLDGETQRERLDRFCRKLELNFYFILDKDAVLERDKSGKIYVKDLRSTEIKKLNPLADRELYDDGRWPEVRSWILRDHKIFTWSKGNLEDMVEDLMTRTHKRSKTSTRNGTDREHSSCEHNGTGKIGEPDGIKITENVELKPRIGKRKSRHKLFNQDHVTYDDVSECMEKLLERCTDRNDDIVELLNLFLTCALEVNVS